MKLRLLLIVASCTGAQAMKNNKFEITSAAFKHNLAIPAQYTCDGENISPQLSWRNAPAGTKSFALIVDDPDAPGGTFVHWVLVNIPANVAQLPQSVDDTGMGAVRGITSFGKKGYGGPCPPSGEHRYFFKLYALDTTLDLNEGATKEQALKAMKGHILATAELMGRYKRQ